MEDLAGDGNIFAETYQVINCAASSHTFLT